MNGLFGSETLDLAVGVVLFFSLASLLCSIVREIIESIVKSRAGDLERALRELLDDPDGTTTVRHLFEHPIVSGLFLGTYNPEKMVPATQGMLSQHPPHIPWKDRRNLPSYIPANQFAAALIDLVAHGPANPAPFVFSEPRTGPAGAADLASAAHGLPSPKLARAILSAVDAAGGDLAAVQARLESWYNGSMDRAAGWYKRRTQTILFVVGLATAIVLNLDAVNVTRHLIHDPSLRHAATSYAERLPTPTTDASPTASPADLKDAGAKLAQLRSDLDSVGMPIGWNPANVQALRLCPVTGAKVADCKASGIVGTPPDPIYELSLLGAAMMIAGWIATALAVMLGAPFWFDLLAKVMIIRSTVKPAQKSQVDDSTEDTRPASTQPGIAPSAARGAAPGAALPVAALAYAAAAEPPSTPNRWAIGPDPEAGLL